MNHSIQNTELNEQVNCGRHKLAYEDLVLITIKMKETNLVLNQLIVTINHHNPSNWMPTF